MAINVRRGHQNRPHHHILFNVTGENQFGAVTGSLTLYSGKAAVLTSRAFSGGGEDPSQFRSNPIPPETYHINLAIRNVADSIVSSCVHIPGRPLTDLEMHHWYGIEKIDIPGGQWEWGHYRAALNEPRANMEQGYRGNFLHGKLRPNDYTHGCICERDEVILAKLWELPAESVHVIVEYNT